MDKYNEAIEILKKYKQDKIIDELQKNKSKELVEQILEIDFEQLQNLYNNIGNDQRKIKIEPIKNNNVEDINKIKKIGEDIIKKEKYAVVTMAGGQRNKTWTQWTKRYIFNRCQTKSKIPF